MSSASMISDTFRCIFVHVPKTGGQSIEKAFLQLHQLTWQTRAELLLRPNPDPSRGPQQLAHLTAAEYLSHRYIDRETFENYFKFAFVRNPWERLLSEYRYRHPRHDMSFRRFVDERFASLDDYSDASRHVMPQSKFLTDASGRRIVDFVGRFENLASDFAKVAGRLGLGTAALGHHNRSTHETFSTSILRKLPSLLPPIFSAPVRDSRRPLAFYYDADLRDRVAEFYAEDIAQFAYSFDQGSDQE
jgi:hypothetical protein